MFSNQEILSGLKMDREYNRTKVQYVMAECVYASELEVTQALFIKNWDIIAAVDFIKFVTYKTV